MRFFFVFISCCGLPTQRSPEPPVPAEEDERSLVPATVPAAVWSPGGKKMRMDVAEWRPSLVSISEDVTPQRERESPRKIAAASGGRDTKKRSGGGTTKVRYRSYSDSGYGSIPSMMPTFSPTPFMF